MATVPPLPAIGNMLQRIPGIAPGGPGGPGVPPPGVPPLPPPGPMPGNIPMRGRQPSPGGEAQSLRDAMAALGFAMQRFQMRAPDVAREIATAMVHIKKAMEKASALPDSATIAPPPPGMPAGGMAQGPGLGLPGGPALGF